MTTMDNKKEMFYTREQAMEHAQKWANHHLKQSTMAYFTKQQQEAEMNLAVLYAKELTLLKENVDQHAYSATGYFERRQQMAPSSSKKQHELHAALEEAVKFGNPKTFSARFSNSDGTFMIDLAKYMVVLDEAIDREDAFAASFFAGRLDTYISQYESNLAHLYIPILPTTTNKAITCFEAHLNAQCTRIKAKSDLILDHVKRICS